MKTIIFAILFIYAAAPDKAAATSFTDVVALLNIKQEATPAEVTTLLGKPTDVDDSKRKQIWHYKTEKGDLTIYWDNTASHLQKFSYSLAAENNKSVFNNAWTRKLVSGETKINDVINTLGTPTDMSVKLVSQELHYSYQHRILHLFFRKGTLVNYCLY